MIIIESFQKLEALAQITSKDEYREALRCIHFTNDYMEATNGYSLMRLDNKNPLDLPNGFMFPINQLENIKKTTKQKEFNVEIDTDNLTVKAILEDTTNQVIFSFKKISVEFPKTDPIIPDNQDTYTTALSIERLEEIVKMGKKLGINGYKFIVKNEPLKPVTIKLIPHGYKAEINSIGVIMPLRTLEDK